MNLRRLYETTFIVNAAIEDADIETVITKVSGYIENNGGDVLEVHRWGRRRLAYPINKKYNGFYVHIVFEAKPSAIPILERFMVLEDTILRHLTLILPKKLRDFRSKVSAETGKAYDSAFVDADKNPVKEEAKSEKPERRGRNYNAPKEEAPAPAPVAEEAPAPVEEA